MMGEDDNSTHALLRRGTADVISAVDASNNEEERGHLCNLLEGAQLTCYGSLSGYAVSYTRKLGSYAEMIEAQCLARFINRPLVVVSIDNRSGGERTTVYMPSFACRVCCPFLFVIYSLHLQEHLIENEQYHLLWTLERRPVVVWHDGGQHFKAIVLD